MELKLATKKIPSEQNLRLLSNLILSLSSKVQSAEEKCITEWEPDVAYIRNQSYVTHENKLYVCVVSCSDSVWTPSHFQVLSDELTEIDIDTVKSWLNLSSEELANLQSLIDDTSISTTHTNSSSHIYMAIQDAIAECKDDTLKQIAKKVSGSYKIANTIADIVSADYIYLLSNGSNYDLYVLVDGTATKVGDTNIDLSEYVKTTDLADYIKTADADGKFATITTVDGKVDKTDIVDNLTSTDTNKPLSANQGKVLKDSIPTNKEVLDKLSENDDGELVYNGKVINTSMYISEETSEYNTNSNTNVTLYFTILGNKMTIFLIQRASNNGKTIGIKYPLPFKSLPTITRTFGTPSGTEKTTENTLTKWSYDQNYGYAKQNELHFMIQGTI